MRGLLYQKKIRGLNCLLLQIPAAIVAIILENSITMVEEMEETQ